MSYIYRHNAACYYNKLQVVMCAGLRPKAMLPQAGEGEGGGGRKNHRGKGKKKQAKMAGCCKGGKANKRKKAKKEEKLR